MALLSNKQIREILGIINKHFIAFTHSTVSPDQIDPADIRDLKNEGIIPKNVNLKSYPKSSYEFGRLVEILKDNKKIKNMDYKQFRRYITSNPIPTTPAEKFSIDNVQHNAATYISSLRDKVMTNASQTINKYNNTARNQISKLKPSQQEWFRDKKFIKPKERAAVREKVVDNIVNRKNVNELASELYHMFDAQGVDFQRIAHTEKNEAICQGKKDELRREEKSTGEKMKVFKRPAPDACKHCKLLYLEKDGVTPILFTLDELEANGTNVGLKVADWKPVVGSIHPWCQCTGPYEMPEGFEFGEHGEIRAIKSGRKKKHMELDDKAERFAEARQDLIEDIDDFIKDTIVRDDDGKIIRRVRVPKNRMMPYLKKRYKDNFSEDVISDLIEERRGLGKSLKKSFQAVSKVTKTPYINDMDLKDHMKTINNESLCNRCGRCCMMAVKYEGITYVITALPCKYLQEIDKNKYMCTVYDDRLKKEVAGDWCSKGIKNIQKGHYPEKGCPYTKDIKNYKGRIVANKEIERAILHELAYEEKPEFIDQTLWDEVTNEFKE